MKQCVGFVSISVRYVLLNVKSSPRMTAASYAERCVGNVSWHVLLHKTKFCLIKDCSGLSDWRKVASGIWEFSNLLPMTNEMVVEPVTH